MRAAVEKICARFGDDYWLKRDSDGQFPEEFYRAMAADGWLGVCIPQAYGGSGRVVEVRDEYMPVIDLEKVFDVPRFDFEHVSNIMVVVEAEGGRVALLVDELLGQQQVVVKNLESNYRRVTDVSGATIMGDGRVALILDIGSLVRRSRH